MAPRRHACAGFDLEGARTLVADYRARTGRALAFRLSTFPDPTRLRQAQLLQEMWTRAGAEVQIDTLDQASFIKPLINGEFDAAIISNFGTADPDFNYLFWHSSLVAPPGQLSINFSHTADPAIDAALDAARRTDDVAGACRLLPNGHAAAERRCRLRVAVPHADIARRHQSRSAV